MNATLQIKQMTVQEKLRAMETLWDELCRQEGVVQVPQWQKTLLDEREHLIKQGKARFSNWESAKKRINRKIS
jgi:putative addiction module component (TIGR02574 family)